ncbi:MAG: cytidine deaminase [Candidatus Diapherotrites archaeon]|nr:cytidine deaminase [Candidatus Diapherotrites archaeon]
MTLTNKELIKEATKVAKLHKITEDIETGSVGSALITDNDNLYVGVSIHACCGVGFCAEHSAIAAMVTKQDFKIKKIVAVNCEGKIYPPCGRCRELMAQINMENMNTEVIISKTKSKKLKELLPNYWQ